MKSPRIVVLGSINMDLVIRCSALPVPGETVIAHSSAEVCGGKGANQAIAASRLGGHVEMIGSVGDDSFAEQLLCNLREARIDTRAVGRASDCASGVAIVAVDDSGQNSIMVVPGANHRVSQAFVAEQESLIAEADVLLCQLELPIETVVRGVELAGRHGVRVILNPAPMPKSFPAELFQVDLLCPNQHEAESLLQVSIRDVADAKSACRQMVDRGARHAIVTLGSEGAVVCANGKCEWIEPHRVTAVDTTAAGDAFAGAVAVFWLELGDLIQAARLAGAAGALAACRSGAQPSLPTRTELETFIRSSSN